MPFSKETTTTEGSSLLENYRIVQHVATGAEYERRPIPVEGRNYALNILTRVASRFESFREDFVQMIDAKSERLSGEQFVALITAHVKGQKVDLNYFRIASKTNIRDLSHRMSLGLSFVPGEEEDQPLVEEEEVERRKTIFGHIKPDDTTPTFVAGPEQEDIEFDAVVADETQFKDLAWRLFHALDVEDANGITWEQFTGFMTDAACKGPVRPNTELINQYRALPPIQRPNRPVQFVRNLPKLGLAGILTQDCRKQRSASNMESVIEMYTPGKWTSTPKKMWLDCSAASFEYIPHLRRMAIGGADMQLRFMETRFDVDGSENLAWQIPSIDTLSRLEWIERQTRLFAASTNGNISTWQVPENVKTRRIPKRIASWKTHNSTVTGMTILPLDNCIVSCSMDPQVTIQDPYRGDIVSVFGTQQSAYRALDYHHGHHLVVTCGFDREIQLWSLHSVSTAGQSCKPILLWDKDEPHRPSIVGVHCVPASQQLLSLDQFGLLKIWDLRMLKVIQNMHLSSNKTHIEKEFASLVYFPRFQQMLCSSKKHAHPVMYTDINANYCPETAEDIIMALQYSSSSGALITSTQTSIQAWEIRSGVLSNQFNVFESGEVTAMTVDPAGRRALLGYRSGQVCFYNALNGHFVTKMAVADVDADILDVACYSFMGIAFAVDSHGTVVGFADREDSLQLCCLEEGTNPKFLRVSCEHDVLLVFHSSFAVSVFILRRQRCALPVWHADLQIHTKQEVKEILGDDLDDGEVYTACMLGKYPAFVCADSLRYISIWVIPPHKDADKCVIKWQTSSIWDISSLAFDDDHSLLFVGDAGGSVFCYDLQQLLKECGFIEKETPTNSVVFSPSSTVRSGSIGSMRKQLSFELPAERTVSEVVEPRRITVANTSDAILVGKFVVERGSRVALLLPVNDLGVLFVSLMDRKIYAIPMTMKEDPPIGYLSLDASRYIFPENDNVFAEQLDSRLFRIRTYGGGASSPKSVLTVATTDDENDANEEEQQSPLRKVFPFQDNIFAKTAVGIVSPSQSLARRNTQMLLKQLQSRKSLKEGMASFSMPSAIARKASFAAPIRPVEAPTEISSGSDDEEESLLVRPSATEGTYKGGTKYQRNAAKNPPKRSALKLTHFAPEERISKRTLEEEAQCYSQVPEDDGSVAHANKMFIPRGARRKLNEREKREKKRQYDEMVWKYVNVKSQKAEVPRGLSDFEMPQLTPEFIKLALQRKEENKNNKEDPRDKVEIPKNLLWNEDEEEPRLLPNSMKFFTIRNRNQRTIDRLQQRHDELLSQMKEDTPNMTQELPVTPEPEEMQLVGSAQHSPSEKEVFRLSALTPDGWRSSSSTYSTTKRSPRPFDSSLHPGLLPAVKGCLQPKQSNPAIPARLCQTPDGRLSVAKVASREKKRSSTKQKPPHPGIFFMKM